MNDVKISIIVPIYNVEKYLRQCLESICLQTIDDIEIICIDDGSTDNSKNIINEYKIKNKNIVVLSQENKGKSNAVNKAIKKARGEYIGFVDPDDWISNDYYEMLWKAAKKTDSDIARSCFVHVYPYKEEENKLNNIIRCNSNKKMMLSVNDHSIVMWDAIYRKDFIIKNNLFLDESLISFEDVAFSFKASLLANRIAPVSKGMYFYRRRNDGLSKITEEKEKMFFK